MKNRSRSPDRAVARGHGLADNAVYRWRKRHPDRQGLPAEEVAGIILSNKR